jgi:hypothetical protein
VFHHGLAESENTGKTKSASSLKFPHVTCSFSALTGKHSHYSAHQPQFYLYTCWLAESRTFKLQTEGSECHEAAIKVHTDIYAP